ncbi:MAG: hypothetical protein QGH45_08025, partial [Myxococcota bacterium]|nr:hypothetical protein [Myxococcota bacterium]
MSRSLLCAIATITLGLPGLAAAQAGGPDDFGYVFRDSTGMHGPEYDWVDVVLTGTHHNTMDDETAVLVSLGFTFEFYGQTYTDVYVHANGGVSFDNGILDDYHELFPVQSGVDQVIAAFWDDLMPIPFLSSPIYSGTIGTAPDRQFVAQWDGVPHAD